MRLNDLKPAVGAKQKRVRLGRGIGSGLGKTCGFGHKGQKSRSGCSFRAGFEGGQTPLQRRLPKFGFRSLLQQSRCELTLSELDNSKLEEINLPNLIQAGLVTARIHKVKVILSGQITRPVKLFVGRELKVTAGAAVAIETAGGTIQ